jgi:O-methyltransferase involved in polyketide biosynthesis
VPWRGAPAGCRDWLWLGLRGNGITDGIRSGKILGMFRRRTSKGKPAADGSDGDQHSGPTPEGGDVRAGDAGDPAGQWGAAPPGIDVSVAHPARVWNFWLGGRDFFAADRAAGEAISREFPHLAQAARAERAFLVRAVRFLAGPARIRQFLDVGAGLPAGGNTHEIAQRIVPEAGIVYADHDPVVIMHAKTLLTGSMPVSGAQGTVSYIDADLRDVATVLAGAASILEFARPVALIMLGILGYVDDFGAARSITSQLMDALPAGSYLAIADGVAGNGATERAQQRYNQTAVTPYVLRRPDQLASFFDGLDLVDPGVVPCAHWRPDVRGGDGAGAAAGGGQGAQGAQADEAAAYCAVARKP